VCALLLNSFNFTNTRDFARRLSAPIVGLHVRAAAFVLLLHYSPVLFFLFGFVFTVLSSHESTNRD